MQYYQDDLLMPEVACERVPMPTDAEQSGKGLEKYLNQKVFPAFQDERNRLRKLEMWGTGKQPEVRALKRNTERAVLQRLARTPWVPLMISTFAQQLIVDGYHTEENGGVDAPPSKSWETWNRNKMAMQQLPINRATMMFGYSYLRITKGEVSAPTEGQPEATKTMAVMRAVSPTRCFCLYADPYGDEYPQYALERLPDATWRWWLPTGHYVPLSFKGGKFTAGVEEETDYGTIPIVRYLNQIDLEGRCWGDVEPVIDLAARIDKTAFDRLLVQHFNSFKVRWATGLEQADTPEGVEQDKIRVGNEDILIASDIQARFGTLDETSMTGFIEAYKCDLEVFAAVMQLPPNLMGQVINVAADALDGARRQTYQRLFEKQTVMGEAHAQAMRLAAQIEGRTDDADDFTARIHWQDPEVRSLAQFADAWGKIVDQLGVPKWAAWNKIPGVEQNEVDNWKRHALDDDPLSKYLREVVGVSTTSIGVDPKTGAPKPLPVATPPAPIGGAPGAPGGAGGTNSTQNQPKPRNDNGNPKSAGS